MARSRTPRLAHTDSHQGYDNQRDPRSAPEWRPHVVRGQEAHSELEHDEILMKALSQVRSGGNVNDDN
jgi:hypothetical protein